jgi:hypothetical protein
MTNLTKLEFYTSSDLFIELEYSDSYEGDEGEFIKIFINLRKLKFIHMYDFSAKFIY